MNMLHVFLQENNLYYIGGVLLGVSLLTLWLYLKVTRAERQQRKHLLGLRKFQSVRTESPMANPVQNNRLNSLKNLNNQFTVIRSVLFPGMLLLTLLLIAIPFVGALPGNIVSLFIAALTVVLGITLRPFLGNAIAGIVLSMSKLIRVGDTIKINDFYGLVYDISSTHTTIKVWDWRHYVVPNEELLRSDFINYTVHNQYLWVSVKFWIAYESDINDIEEIARTVPYRSQWFSDYEAPQFWFMETSKDAIKCMVAAWANSPSDGWNLASDIRKELVKEFQRKGIRTHGLHVQSQPEPDNE